jgi:hypothetical protein
MPAIAEASVSVFFDRIAEVCMRGRGRFIVGREDLVAVVAAVTRSDNPP